MKLTGFSGAMKLFLLVGVLALFSVACAESKVDDTADGIEQPPPTDEPIYSDTDPVVTDLGAKYPVIELDPAELCAQSALLEGCSYEFDQGGVSVGGQAKTTVTIKNTGERSLNVKTVALSNYQAGEGAVEDEPAIKLDLSTVPAFQKKMDEGYKYYWVAPQGKGTTQVPEELTITMVYTRPADELDRSANLVITTDASNKQTVTIKFSTAKGFPKIQVSPDWIDFQQVGQGELKEEKVNVLNTGAADLEITGFTLTGSEFYTLLVQGTEYPVSEQTTGKGIVFDDPVVVEPGNATYFKVRFEPLDDKPATAKLFIYSNDVDKADGVEVKITGNEDVPCIAVNPQKVNFGGKKYGDMAVVPLEISACGEAPLELYDIHIKEGSSPDFDVKIDTFLDHTPAHDDPVIVPIGGSVMIEVIFIPDAPNPMTEDGSLILDEGILVIVNNSFAKDKEVELSGAGVEIECPTAIIKCAEGDEVIPQTVLHLFGDESSASNGTIQKWEWSVEQPAGSQSVFVPSYTFPNPTFETNVAGVYTFYLTVYDQTNTPSCFPATYEVVVIPDEAIHIELLWHTPEDPDETDTGPEAGSDLDLHFLHPWAAGPDLDGDGAPDGWFDIPFDCFWFNAHPNWGSYDPAINDDPGLDRDDTDGAGPENINLDIPENVIYRVGIHYWNDHGYGASYATVRVYIYAQLVFEVADVMLVDSDMWEVCTVEWPSGKVQVITTDDGGYKITPAYHNPYFFQ